MNSSANSNSDILFCGSVCIPGAIDTVLSINNYLANDFFIIGHYLLNQRL